MKGERTNQNRYLTCQFNITSVEMITIIVEDQITLDYTSESLLSDINKNGLVIYDSEFDRHERIAVIQMMTNRDTIYIIRISMFNDMPEIVRSILKNTNIIKIGHSLDIDERVLMKNYGFGIEPKLDVRSILMCLDIKIPCMGIKSNLKDLVRNLVSEISVIELSWVEKMDWNHINNKKIQYLESDVRGVYEICSLVMGLSREIKLDWTIIKSTIPRICDMFNQNIDQRSWSIFNCQ